MQDLTQILTEDEVGRLRAAYDTEALLKANAQAFATVYPPLAAWGQTAASLFFGASPIAPRERELSLITLLTHRSPGLSLANHVYWGLMEGLTVGEICQAVGLAGCYCGLPTFTQGVFTIDRTFGVLKRLAATTEPGSRAVLSALVAEFAGTSLG